MQNTPTASFVCKVVTFANKTNDKFVRQCAVKNDGNPVTFVHVVTGRDLRIVLLQPCALLRWQFEVYAHIAAMFINQCEGFSRSVVPHHRPVDVVKRIVFIAKPEIQASRRCFFSCSHFPLWWYRTISERHMLRNRIQLAKVCER